MGTGPASAPEGERLRTAEASRFAPFGRLLWLPADRLLPRRRPLVYVADVTTGPVESTP